MESGKTIKEIADQLHVSKQAVLKKVSEQERQIWFNKSGNKFIVSEEGEKTIKSRFSHDSKKRKNENQNDNKNDSIHILVDNLVNDLKKDKNQLISQIDELNGRLKDNQRLLDQQQQLSLKAQQRVDQLERQMAIDTPSPEQNDQNIESSQISEYEKKIKSLESSLEENNEDLEERKKVMEYLKKEYDVDNLKDLLILTEEDQAKKWWQFWKK